MEANDPVTPANPNTRKKNLEQNIEHLARLVFRRVRILPR